MSLPIYTPGELRAREDVAALAVVTQANALQIFTAAHKRNLTDAPTLPSPGPVRAHREALIDWRTLKEYDDASLMLRAQEIWGQHCLFCWAFFGQDPHQPPPFAKMPPENQLRTTREVRRKSERVIHDFTALRNEASRREEQKPPQAQRVSGSTSETLDVFGQPLTTCDDNDLLACTCLHAGMLAAIRWVADSRWSWGDAHLMDLNPTPAE